MSNVGPDPALSDIESINARCASYATSYGCGMNTKLLFFLHFPGDNDIQYVVQQLPSPISI